MATFNFNWVDCYMEMDFIEHFHTKSKLEDLFLVSNGLN